MTTKRRRSTCAAALLLLGAMGGASAATVTPVSVTTFMTASEPTMNIPFVVQVQGTYKATIQDFQAPTAFQTLLLAITTVNPIGGGAQWVDGAGGMASFTFDGVPGVQYVANIGGIPLAGIGLMGADVSLVPLPASAVMFLSAMLGLTVVARRRQRAERAHG